MQMHGRRGVCKMLMADQGREGDLHFTVAKHAGDGTPLICRKMLHSSVSPRGDCHVTQSEAEKKV